MEPTIDQMVRELWDKDSSYEPPLAVPGERIGLNLDILPEGYRPD